MQLHIVSKNSEFEEWTAGDPDSYIEQETNTVVRQLDKNVYHDHPWRVRTVVGPGDDYVLNGNYAYRAEIAAAAGADDWRIWPQTSPGTTPDVDLTTFWTIVTGVNDSMRMVEFGVTATIVIPAGDYTVAALALALKTAMEAHSAGSGNTYTWTFDSLARTWTVVRATGADSLGFDWTDALSTIADTLGFTADDTGATTYTGDGPSPPGMTHYRSTSGKRWGLNITARNSVHGNLLRLRVVGMDSAFAVPYYLSQDSTTLAWNWNLAADYLEFPMMPAWAEYGVSFITTDQKYFLWQISNGTAGAQNLDVGRVELRPIVDGWEEGQV